MTKYLISTIIVSLNSKENFLETLKSVLNQNFPNHEIIVVDGNSTDGTKNEILKSREKISKFIIEDDNGIYDAMNKGIKIAEGKWAIFMNSGDIFENSNVLNKVFDMNIHSADIIFGNTLIKNNGLKYIKECKYFNKKTIVMPFCHQSSFTRTQILKQNMFEKEYKLSADFNFFYKCYLKNNNFLKFEEIIAKVKGGGVSDIKRQEVYMENIEIFKKNKNYNKIIKLYFFKLYELIKQFFKYILPNFVTNFILKNKYKNRGIK